MTSGTRKIFDTKPFFSSRTNPASFSPSEIAFLIGNMHEDCFQSFSLQSQMLNISHTRLCNILLKRYVPVYIHNFGGISGISKSGIEHACKIAQTAIRILMDQRSGCSVGY